ncbi:MAG: sugar phosphate isomerase/epimerase [Candidatus Hydrogenedentes bacterium]|nr:sugar phosphate isomerase/epimerase [Candidatus Hydrogenedentota bacterium]
MSTISRRQFLAGTATGTVALGLAPALSHAAAGAKEIRMSACDWSLGAGGPDGLAAAKDIRLDGLELSAGDAADTLKIADPPYREKYKTAVKSTGVVVSSVAMGFLNGSPLATDPRGVAWLEQTIEATKDLDASVILVAFFGKGDLRKGRQLKESEIDALVGKLKEAAPKAKASGVILGLENTLSAEQNLRILDRVASDAVRVYYDIGNSTDNGYDVPAEIRMLRGRICQFHFKDGGDYLGEGKGAMKPVAEAIHAIQYKGWIVLETAVPSKDRIADFRKNADFVRGLMGIA